MPGRAKEDPTKTQQQEIAEKKQAFLAYFRKWPVKKAAAEAVNRSSDTIDIWLREDADFSEAFLSARTEWAKKQARRLDPTNLLANIYPEELKPPKQEVESTITTIEGQSAEYLLAEAKRLGIDTTQYESLLTRPPLRELQHTIQIKNEIDRRMVQFRARRLHFLRHPRLRRLLRVLHLRPVHRFSHPVSAFIQARGSRLRP